MNREGVNGFTLLEMLVVLVVLGLLLVGLNQGVHLGVMAWGRQAGILDERAELDAVDRTLRGLLTRVDATTSGGAPTLSGTADRLRFLGDLPLAAPAPRHAEMTLLVDQGRLVLRWTRRPHETPTGPAPAEAETVVLPHIDRITFSYLAPNDPDGWRDEWTNGQAPALIRIRLGFPAGDRRHWPDILIAPMLEPAN